MRGLLLVFLASTANALSITPTISGATISPATATLTNSLDVGGVSTFRSSVTVNAALGVSGNTSLGGINTPNAKVNIGIASQQAGGTPILAVESSGGVGTGGIFFGPSAAAGRGGRIGYSDSGSTVMTIASTHDNAAALMRFLMQTNGSTVTAMGILGSGFIGIGTTSPASKLHMSSGTLTVDGTAAALLVSGGSVTASAFFGDGSHLTGISAGAESNTYTSSKTFTNASGVLVNYGITIGSITLTSLGSESKPSILLGSSGSGARIYCDGDNSCYLYYNQNSASLNWLASQVQFPTRSSGFPSISFFSDSNTGFNSSSGDTLEVVTGGVKAGFWGFNGLYVPIKMTAAAIHGLQADASELGGLVMCTNCTIPYSLCVATGAASVNQFQLVGTSNGCY